MIWEEVGRVYILRQKNKMNYIHFNNAGSSLPEISTTKIINKYFELESKIGGYEAEEKEKSRIEKFYVNTSKLINCEPREISFFSNATLSWNLFFKSINFNSLDEIIIAENEYTSNFISILKRKHEFNKLKIIKIDQNGLISLEDLKNKINNRTKLVSINHIASQCGTVMPVQEIGNILKKKNPDIIYFLDCSQTVGHIEIDVKKIKCDVLTASGRKFLRGPRGTAFLYIKSKIISNLKPVFQDMSNTQIETNHNLKLIKTKNFLEMYEHSPGLKLGLANAVEKITRFGITKINKKVIELSKYLRKRMLQNKNFMFVETEKNLSGINTIVSFKIDNKKIFKFLKKNKINIFISNHKHSFLYFKKLKIKSVLRISFHHFNKKKEIDILIKTLNSIND